MRWAREIPNPSRFRRRACGSRRAFRPEGPDPFPAVVGLHNCTGLTNRAGKFGTRYRDWAERLSKNGFVVLLPDSHSRAEPAANARFARARSAMTASAWPTRTPHASGYNRIFVAPDRVSLLGWSSGAIAALWTVRARPQPQTKEGADFRSAVAFYPGCRRLSNAAWSARVPTLILIGRADNQASAAVCQQMVAGARGRSGRLEIRVYPGAHHDFDHPNRPLQVRTGLTFSADGAERARGGTNPAARSTRIERVLGWFER